MIVITHNPTTMEAAPVWYGVTMQQPGISRVLGMASSRAGLTFFLAQNRGRIQRPGRFDFQVYFCLEQTFHDRLPGVRTNDQAAFHR